MRPIRHRSLMLLLIFISNHSYAMEEKYNTGWVLNLDNDILAERDRDYTGGIALTLSAQNNHIDTASTATRDEFKTSYEANVGFSTDVNASLSWRWGRINPPWWSFNPQHSEYVQLGAPAVTGSRQADKGELYLWAGTTVKYRFYSSLMQGQFRDSIVKFSSDEVENLLAQFWLGGTWEFADNFRGSFFYRASTREFEGNNAHYLVWAGLIISRSC